MAILIKSFVCLILILVKSKNCEADANEILAETNEEYDALLQLALFDKINRLIIDLKNITCELADLKKRQLHYNQIARYNIDALKSDMRQTLLQHEVRSENLAAGLQQQIANSFYDQETFLRTYVFSTENWQAYEDMQFKYNRQWQTILRRQDDSLSFDRNWLEYKSGFGNIKGNFFIGLEALHAITTYSDPQELFIVLQDFDNKTRYAKYDDFVIGSESDKYKIQKLGNYQGDAGDSFSQHFNMKFSTKDQDNDNSTRSHCAKKYQGGWWFSNCFSSHLTGTYYYQPLTDKQSGTGLVWYSWHDLNYSLKYVEMMIRPK